MVNNRNIAGTVGAWIGLKRKADNMFYWVDSSPLQDQNQNWANGEPNNSRGNENCVYMYGGEGGKWNDEPCDLTAGYLFWRKNALVTLCQKPI